MMFPSYSFGYTLKEEQKMVICNFVSVEVLIYNVKRVVSSYKKS